jgi:hypothetical protein
MKCTERGEEALGVRVGIGVRVRVRVRDKG